MKRVLIFLLIIIIILCVGLGGYYYYSKTEDRKYVKRLEDTNWVLFETCKRATEITDDYILSWRKTILDDAYEVNGKPVNGNVSLAMEYELDKSKEAGTYQSLGDAMFKSKEMITSLGVPPSEYKEIYDLLLDNYSSAKELNQMVQHPDGSLLQFSARMDKITEEVIRRHDQASIRLEKYVKEYENNE